MAPHEVRAKYPMMEAFRNLAAGWDPTGKFRNPFVNTYVFDSKT